MTTKQQTGHTPLPWRIGGMNDYQIAAGDEVDIARAMSKALNAHTLEERRITHEERAANAELIVRAVNAHADLVEVVEAMANFDGRNITTHLKDMARAALAKARQ